MADVIPTLHELACYFVGPDSLGQPADTVANLLATVRRAATEGVAVALEAQGLPCTSDLVLGCVEMAALVATLTLPRPESREPVKLSRDAWLALCSDAYERAERNASARAAMFGLVVRLTSPGAGDFDP